MKSKNQKKNYKKLIDQKEEDHSKIKNYKIVTVIQSINWWITRANKKNKAIGVKKK